MTWKLYARVTRCHESIYSELVVSFYSIGARKVFSYDYFEAGRWPTLEELPSIDGMLYEDIVKKCWLDAYNSMKPLYEDVVDLLGQRC